VASSFATNDSPPVKILLSEDGEQISGSVYTFSIEFCTHDCPVLAFTRINALKIDAGDAPWMVASSSGMVLKLVTGPITFETVEQAVSAARRLAQALALSISGSTTHASGAITLEQLCSRWRDPHDPFAVEFRSLQPQSQGSPQFLSWQEVGKQLRRDNIDIGMNVSAALLRYANNAQNWEDYLGSTVVYADERDRERGCVARVNMPMTLAGYFLYMAKVRLPRADRRIEEASVEQSRGVEGQVTDWFWNSLLASACNSYMLRVFGAETLATRGIATGIRNIDPNGMKYNDLRAVAFLYLIANKVLGGALAALSAPSYIAKQQSAWRNRPTDVPVKDVPVEDGTAEPASGAATCTGQISSPEWTGYYDSLMDLTGLWFRAALREVLGCEEFTPGFCRAVAFELRAEVDISVWHSTLKRQLMFLEESRWDTLFTDRGAGWDDLRQHRWKPLVLQVARMERAIAEELDAFAEWRERSPERPSWDYGSPLGCADRPAVDPQVTPEWEARFETITGAIPNPEIDAWTYLVERRLDADIDKSDLGEPVTAGQI
jgi:hypothetical protein